MYFCGREDCCFSLGGLKLLNKRAQTLIPLAIWTGQAPWNKSQRLSGWK